MKQSGLLALLVGAASVSLFATLWLTGFTSAVEHQRQYAAPVLVSIDAPVSTATSRPHFLWRQSVAANVVSDVSSATATATPTTTDETVPDPAAPDDSVAAVPIAVAPQRVLGTGAHAPTATPVPATKTAATAGPSSFERALAERIHELTNDERTKQGLTAYTYDRALAGPAFTYSVAMQTHSFFSHTDPSGCGLTCRFAKTKYAALAWGENLALWESSYTPGVDEVAEYFVREWKKSAGHRANLLSDTYTHEGVGVAVVGNKVIATVRFAEPK